MSNIFGSIFVSKEEKEKRLEEFSKKIFPYGDDQRLKVSQLLGELFPEDKEKYLMMHYILIKEKIMADDGESFEDVYKKVNKKRVVKNNPRLKPVIQAIIESDLNIDKNLNYPTVEELKKI